MTEKLTLPNLLAFLRASGPVTKREIADAFAVEGDIRIALKDTLKTLQASGQIIKIDGQRYTVPDGLPDVAPLVITDISLDGEITAQPTEWDPEQMGDAPSVLVETNSAEHASLVPGDQILTRIKKSGDDYVGSIIRRIHQSQKTVIGEIITMARGSHRIRTLQKRGGDEYDVSEEDLNGAQPYDLVRATVVKGPRGSTRDRARVDEVIGQSGDPKVISLVAAHEAGLRLEFPQVVIDEADRMERPKMQDGRVDIRNIPLVTIDGEDARDFDDAVFAEPDDDPENRGGFHLVVAIADVSYYVRTGTALDQEAYKRGNSTYFPDRVLPMLPEGLSNDLCSLKPKEDRYCLAVHLWIDAKGHLKKYKFIRALMKSAARLTYNQVQAAYDGMPDAAIEPLVRPVIFPLYDAFRVLASARMARGTLDLDVPERRIVVNKAGEMTGVTVRERLASHQLIEEFMILANVAAARALQTKKAPCVYRIHDIPSFEKLQNLRNYLATFGIETPQGEVTEPAQLSEVLKKSKGKPFTHLVQEQMLRTQMQAVYSTDNIGHFGLALDHYAHFTSPIRRYADLLVHRSLITAYKLGPGGLEAEDVIRLPAMCDHISVTERQSMEGERNAVDRFTASYMADKVGAIFDATISSVTGFGIFVRLAESGADGLIPMRALSGDFFVHDERLHALIGRRTGIVYRLGAPISVELVEAAPLAGALSFRPVDDEGADIPGFELQVAGGGDHGSGDGFHGSRGFDRDDRKGDRKKDRKRDRADKGKGRWGAGKDKDMTERKSRSGKPDQDDPAFYEQSSVRRRFGGGAAEARMKKAAVRKSPRDEGDSKPSFRRTSDDASAPADRPYKKTPYKKPARDEGDFDAPQRRSAPRRFDDTRGQDDRRDRDGESSDRGDFRGRSGSRFGAGSGERGRPGPRSRSFDRDGGDDRAPRGGSDRESGFKSRTGPRGGAGGGGRFKSDDRAPGRRFSSDRQRDDRGGERGARTEGRSSSRFGARSDSGFESRSDSRGGARSYGRGRDGADGARSSGSKFGARAGGGRSSWSDEGRSSGSARSSSGRSYRSRDEGDDRGDRRSSSPRTGRSSERFSGKSEGRGESRFGEGAGRRTARTDRPARERGADAPKRDYVKSKGEKPAFSRSKEGGKPKTGPGRGRRA